MKRTFKVSTREKGQRLLAFLREKCPDAPSVKALKRSIEGKLCRINGKIETFSTHILKTGDTVEIEIDREAPVKYKPLLLWEDDVLAAYDKPAGVVCEPKAFPGKLIHRLDKDTSGVVLVAKNEKTLEQMIELFRNKKVQKEYLAIVDGLVRDKKKNHQIKTCSSAPFSRSNSLWIESHGARGDHRMGASGRGGKIFTTALQADHR